MDTGGESNIEKYWVPNDEEVWTPCTIKSQTNDTAYLLSPSEKVVQIPLKKFQQLEHAEESQLSGVDDICELSFVNEAAMLHTVRVRYLEDLIYTRVARILIAVNPFQSLPIYSSQVLDTFRKCTETMEHPPHIFAVGHDAMLGMRERLANRVVLISGESGAGKTESAKLVLSYVSGVVKTGEEGGIEESVMQTNGIFEAFGNAMTVRNNNSSRFGKLLEIRFNASMRMQGCFLTNYLLETTRVVRQSKKERNYHIFYQLLKASAAEDGTFAEWVHSHISQLGLKKLNEYYYLQGLSDAPGINDIKEFHCTLASFECLSFSESLQKNIFTVLAGILALGNVEFKLAGDIAVVDKSAENPLEQAAGLFGVDASTVEKILLIKKLVVGRDVTEKPLTDVQARNVRDTLVRVFYGRLFDWLKDMMNKALGADETGKTATLGILDIAGFESLEKNSLEQLLINLSNEHLQKSFNDTVFKTELADYEAEGVQLPSHISFKDNSDIIELIDGKTGILAVLDDDMAMGKASDKSYTEKIQKNFAKHPCMVKPRFNSELSFSIRHFAGEVHYNTDGFLDKNAEKMPDDVAELMAGSSVELLQLLGNELLAEAEEKARTSRGKSGKQKSSSKQFRESLGLLVQKIGDSERHYIRCVKPNADKVPRKFGSPAVMEQLLLSGILEAIHIRQQGFCTRTPFGEFVHRYKTIVDFRDGSKKQAWGKDSHNNAVVLKGKLVELMGSASEELCLGRSKVFCTTFAYNTLEKMRAETLYNVARAIQAKTRMFLTRKKMMSKRSLQGRLQRWLASAEATVDRNGVWTLPSGSALEQLQSDERAKQMLEAGTSLFQEADSYSLENATVYAARVFGKRIQTELDLVVELADLAASVDPTAIDNAVARTVDLEMPERDTWSELRYRSRALVVQLPLVKFMEEILALAMKPWEEGSPDLDTEVGSCIGAVQEAGLLERPENWISELQGAELLHKVSGIHNMMSDMQALLKSVDMTAIETALQQMKVWNLPETQTSWDLSSRLDTLKVQSPLADRLHGLANVEGHSASSFLKDLVYDLSTTGLDTNLDRWIPELYCIEIVKDASAQHAALLVLESLATSIDLAAIGEGLRQARVAGVHQSLVDPMDHRFNQLKVQLPLVHRLERLFESETCNDEELKALVSDFQREGLDNGRMSWLAELTGQQLMEKAIIWYTALFGLEAFLTSIDSNAMETALQASKDAGFPQTGTAAKVAERLEWVKWQKPHVDAMAWVLSLDISGESATDPDGELKKVKKGIEDDGLSLEPEVSWLPEFDIQKLTVPFSARLVALDQLEAAGWGFDIAKIERAIESATRAGLPKGQALRDAGARLELLRVQLPLVEEMDAALTCDVSGQKDCESTCDEQLKKIASKLIEHGFRESPDKWVEGLSGPEMCSDIMRRYDALITLEGLYSSTDPQEIEAALMQAQAVGLPRGVAISTIEKRCQQLHLELPLLHAMQQHLSEEGPYEGDRLKQVMEKIEAARRHQDGTWLPELAVGQMLADVSARHQVLLELEALMTSTDVEAIKVILDRAKNVGLGNCLATHRLEQRLPLVICQLGILQAILTLKAHSTSTPDDYDDLLSAIASDIVKNHLDQKANWLLEIAGFEMAIDVMNKNTALEMLRSASNSHDSGIIWQAYDQGCAANIPREGASKLFVVVSDRRSMLSQVYDLATCVEVEPIKNAIDKATGMDLAQSTEVQSLTQRLFTLEEQLPLIDGLNDALAASGDDGDEELRSVYIDLVQRNPRWLPELPGPSLFVQVEARYNAMVALEALSKSTDIDAIKAALATADEAALPEGLITGFIKDRLSKLEKQLPHLNKLEEAMQIKASGDARVDMINHLNKAVGSAEAAGLKSVEDWLPELPGAKLKQDAAKKASLTRAEVRASRMIKAAQLHKDRKSTFHAAANNAQAVLQDKLRRAADRYDCRELASLLGDATRMGVDLNALVQFRLILQQLQSEKFIERAINDVQLEVKKPNPNPRELWRLMNLADQLQVLGGDDMLMRNARLTITVASRQTRMVSAGDADALALEDLFGDLSKWPVLASGASVSYQRKMITTPLTKVPKEFHEEAVRNFRNIMTWMLDRPAAGDTEQQSAVEAVVKTLTYTDELRDEIYVQVLKQLHHNQSLRSTALGWELLVSLCKSMLPSDRLLPYLISFLEQCSVGTDKQVAAQANRCLSHCAELEDLPRMQGYLMKSRPQGRQGKFSRSFDKRWLLLRNMHIYWWKSSAESQNPEAAGPDGGPLCKGYLSLAATQCIVERNPEDEKQFFVKPSDTGWLKGRMEQEEKMQMRVFTFEIIEPENRDTWVSAIQQHIDQAAKGKSTRLDTMVQEFFLKPKTGEEG